MTTVPAPPPPQPWYLRVLPHVPLYVIAVAMAALVWVAIASPLKTAPDHIASARSPAPVAERSAAPAPASPKGSGNESPDSSAEYRDAMATLYDRLASQAMEGTQTDRAALAAAYREVARVLRRRAVR